MAKSNVILLAVGVVAVAGIAYVTMTGNDGGVPEEGAQGTMVTPADQHQANKTQFYEGLNKEKEIEDLAKIAATFDTAPAEAQRMLREHGWSKADYDEMIEVIRKDDEKNRVFQAAKRLALQQ